MGTMTANCELVVKNKGTLGPIGAIEFNVLSS